MKRLDDLSLIQRIALAVAITVLAIIILIFISWLINEPKDADAQVPKGDLYADIAPDVELLKQDKIALVDAYHDQVVHLFSIWLKGQAKNTAEISAGLKLARNAYAMAMEQIAKREKELDYKSQGAPK